MSNFQFVHPLFKKTERFWLASLFEHPFREFVFESRSTYTTLGSQIRVCDGGENNTI